MTREPKEDSGQTGRMPRLIWAFAGRTGHFVSFVMRRLKLQLQVLSVINPHLPSGPIHPYQLDESISNFRGVWCPFFIFILFRKDIPARKQWRPWSDAALCGVWSGSALFAFVQTMGR